MLIPYIASRKADTELLKMRVLMVFTTPHNHPGIPGIAEGAGCMRCNAEKALDELCLRAERG